MVRACPKFEGCRYQLDLLQATTLRVLLVTLQVAFVLTLSRAFASSLNA